MVNKEEVSAGLGGGVDAEIGSGGDVGGVGGVGGGVFVRRLTDKETVHHRGRAKRHKRGIRSAKIGLNLTSMIDIIFLLLIYFVVTASFTQGEGVLIARLPEGTGQSSVDVVPASKLYIYVSDAGDAGFRLRVGLEGSRVRDEPVDFEGLYRALKGKMVDDETNTGIYDAKRTPVVIQPSGGVRWQHVLNAYNAAIRAKFEQVAFGKYKR